MPSDRTIRIARLESEVQAQLLDDLLTQRGIPHLIRNYHDNADDGVVQTTHRCIAPPSPNAIPYCHY